MKKKVAKTTRKVTKAGKTAKVEKEFMLKLYITGSTIQSQLAIENIKKVCEEHLKNRYELKIIDIYKHPTLAKDEQIIAVPTLVKKLPIPLRRFIGDLSDVSEILLGLDIKPKKKKKS